MIRRFAALRRAGLASVSATSRATLCATIRAALCATRSAARGALFATVCTTISATLWAQEPAQGFGELYAAAEQLRSAGKAEPAELRKAYGLALQAFLRMPRESAGYRQSLPAATFTAWQAGDARLAPQLAAEAWESGVRDGAAAALRLRILLDAGQTEAAARFAMAVEAEQWEAVREVLAGPTGIGDGRLLQAADRWLRVGMRELGLWAFRAQAKASGDHPIALQNLALALRHAGEEAESEATYRRALAKAPDDSLIWNDFGLFLKGAGRDQAAAEAFTKGRELENPPGSSPAIPNLLLLARKTGKPQLADPVEAMATVLSVRPDAALARRIAIDQILGRR